MKTVQELFEGVGGSVQLAAALGLNQYTVDRWIKNGIPQWHWAKIIEVARVSVEDLQEFNEDARNKKNK